MKQSDPCYGVIFPNDRKTPGSKQPDYNGTATCCHCEKPMQLAGWKKQKEGRPPFLSLKLQPVREPQSSDWPKDSDDGSIPF